MAFEIDHSRKPLAQGDMYLIPIMAIPDGVQAKQSENGAHILTHSESGHHHVVMDRPGVSMFSGMKVFADMVEQRDRDFLLIEGDPVELVHLRVHHTHAPQIVSPGAWLIQRQAAYTPQGWERARD
jgi:hypothetical protein